MTNGFSTTVARFFRAFHRSHDADPADDASHSSSSTASSSSSSSSLSSSSASAFLLLAAGAGRSPPKHVRMPNGFTRHVRQLVDYVSLVAKQRAASSASASAIARRHAAAAKALDRIMQQLRARTDSDQTGTRAVPLNAALEQLLTVWECVLQCIDLSRAATTTVKSSTTERLSSSSSTSSASADDSTRLETAARRLLALLIQQREFDVAIMALGRGECNMHQNDGTRKRSIIAADSGRADELRVSMRTSRRNSVSLKRPPLPRPLPSKRDVAKTSDAPLCVLTKKYLDLHQTTLRLLQEAYVESGDRLDDRHARDTISDRTLLLQLLATSYVRVPALRDAILAGFQQSVENSDGRRRRLMKREQRRQRGTSISSVATAMAVRGRSVTLLDEVNLALFRWTQSLHPLCHSNVAPYNRDGYWSKETRHVALAMKNLKFQRVLLAQLMDHFLSVGGAGGIDWKCLPGATTLKETFLTMTEAVFATQLRTAEQTVRDKQDASAEGASALKSQTEQSFALSATDDWTVGLFLQQTMRVLAYNPLFIHDWMMTILHNTNVMVSAHVTLCLRYLSQLLTEFPAYFSNDRSATSTVLLEVFTRLLQSDHYEVLRNTELFLMKHGGGFSAALRESLTAVFAAEFKRLFLHWNRDVRFCYYHMLLYLTYPGNRLVLGAKSDELLMGAQAAYLFEIPGLVRHTTSTRAAQWDAFDAPLCELITHVNRMLKQTQTTAPASTSLKPRKRLDASSNSNSRMSMTLRPKPARASLTTRPNQYGRASFAGSSSTGRMSLSSTMPSPAGPKPATRSSMPAAPVSAPSVLQTPPSPAWIEALPPATVQRSVQEYRRHVETYFAFARQISVHEPVPTPMLQSATRA